jgi:hypothetical protein
VLWVPRHFDILVQPHLAFSWLLPPSRIGFIRSFEWSKYWIRQRQNVVRLFRFLEQNILPSATRIALDRRIHLLRLKATVSEIEYSIRVLCLSDAELTPFVVIVGSYLRAVKDVLCCVVLVIQVCNEGTVACVLLQNFEGMCYTWSRPVLK